MSKQTNIESLETEWWQPLSCGCDPIVESVAGHR